MLLESFLVAFVLGKIKTILIVINNEIIILR